MSQTLLEFLCKVVENEYRHCDPHEANHGMITAELAEKLAERAGLSRDIIYLIKHGARIHDWGKIAIAEHIRNKPSKLTRSEKAMMDAHTVIGYEMFMAMNFDQTVITVVGPIVRNHHECWDGSGYPDGLKDEQIPISARIVKICDYYEAMTDDRPEQKSKITDKSAIERMVQRYDLFDPHLLKLFVKMMT